jgi:CubicO group peptidase (beta-lactamase class C family)
MPISGFVASGYEEVRDVFKRLVDDGRETGAGLSIWAGGQEVVSLNGGWADAERTMPWTADTLAHTYSVSKPFAALTALVAVAAGKLTLDDPVAGVWPEYAGGGKETTTLRHILTHRAGVPAFGPTATTIDPLDDAALRKVLASAPAESAPGTAIAEHALTYGHLIDGVLRAATGSSLGELYAGTVRPALGIDAWFGVPDVALRRVAQIEHALPGGAEQFVTDAAPAYKRVLATPAGTLDPALLNSTAWRQAVFGAINLHASARGLAQFYASLTSTDGPVHRLLGPELQKEYLDSQACGLDGTVGISLNWTLGFLRTDAFIGLGGLGGSAAYWSLRHNHAVGYVTRRLQDHSRLGEIAAILDDDLNMQVTCP